MSQSASRPPSPVSDFLSRLHPGPGQHVKALSLWPLVSDEGVPVAGDAPSYVTLAEALAAGTLRVDEVSEDGSVPHVAAENRGDVAVLVMFGEELRGAKQNRVANASFLVPPRATVHLDVSCVEQGRWGRRRGAAFEASHDVLSHAMRRKMAEKVRASRRRGARFDADQGEVWDGVAERLARARVRSDTVAWADHLKARRAQLAELEGAFHGMSGQCGFVAAIGGEVVGLEAIGRPEVFARAFHALLGSYLIDAVDGPAATPGAPDAGAPRFDAPEPFLEALARAPVERSRSLGLGDDLRLAGEHVRGCALVAGDVVQLTGYPRPRRGSL